MLQPLQLGTKKFSTNLIQAPLAGISCAPFRELVWQFGGVAYCCTEMLSAQHLAKDIDRSPRYHTQFASEGSLCWQLSGKNPDDLAQASARAIELGADIIDLNCGCPQPKIRKKGCGTKLLTEEKKLSELIKAMQQNPNTPITVKMRVDADKGEHCDISVAQMLEQTGINGIIVHGRHWTHDYSQPCLLDTIAKIVDAVSIPVIGNGDIEDIISLQNMFQHTRCKGFMIARASVGQPWLFAKLTAQTNGEDYSRPTNQGIGKLFLQHVQGLIKLDGEFNAMMQCRKFGKYYAKTLTTQATFLEQLYQTETYHELDKIIQCHFV